MELLKVQATETISYIGIRLDRQFFKICFISKRILMMPQNNMLQIRKRIMKSDILFSSFFLFL